MQPLSPEASIQRTWSSWNRCRWCDDCNYIIGVEHNNLVCEFCIAVKSRTKIYFVNSKLMLSILQGLNKWILFPGQWPEESDPLCHLFEEPDCLEVVKGTAIGTSLSHFFTFTSSVYQRLYLISVRELIQFLKQSKFILRWVVLKPFSFFIIFIFSIS